MKRVVITLSCLLSLALAACGSADSAPTGPAAPPARAAVPSASPASTPAALPAASADDPAGTAPAFQCQGDRSGTSGSAVTAVRVATHDDFDRFVIEFGGGQSRYEVTQRANASFVADPSGRALSLLGSAGLLVRLEPASAFGSYAGPTDLTTGFPSLREARQTGDFEGVTQWGLGLAHPACMRVFTLSNPSRLVIDVRH